MAHGQTIKPLPAEVLAARQAIQRTLAIGIAAAQDWCASAGHTQRRPWQQWETGQRGMHLAFWEILKIKVALMERP
jgi:hypothetical protein